MKLVRFEPAPGCERLGIWFNEDVVDLALASSTYSNITRTETHDLSHDMMAFLEQGEPSLKAAQEVAKWAEGQLEKSGKVVGVSGEVISYKRGEVRLLAPVPKPPKILSFCRVDCSPGTNSVNSPSCSQGKN